MNSTNRPDSGRDGDGAFNLSGGGLVGHKDAGLEQAREAGAVRRELAGMSASGGDGAGAADGVASASDDAGRDTVLRRAGTPGGVADGGSLSGTTGGERASAGTNHANRSSRDDGNSLGA